MRCERVGSLSTPEWESLATTLLARARDDRFALEHLMGADGAADWLLGFHAQQAAEKLLKAVLAKRSVEFQRTHDLRYLAELAEGNEIELPVSVDELDELTDYAVPLRYEAPVDTPRLDLEATRVLVGELDRWAGEIVVE
jgi:HEPN domain-containing protein